MADATIYDVAARAAVSISTVSLALNQPTRVAAATRERVLSAIDELGFVPKATAVDRARQSLSRIGVLAPFTSYSSFAERLNGVLEVARSQNLEVVLFDADSAAGNTSPLVSTLPITGRIDALIIMSLQLSDEAAQRVKRANLPVVTVDALPGEFTSIGTDDEAGGFAAGCRLIEGGKRRLVFVTEMLLSTAYESQSDRRLAGLRRAARESGLADSAIEIIQSENSVDAVAEAVRATLAAPGPVGVFAHHDKFAAGVLAEALAQGRAVPDDVAVVGFDDGDVAQALGLTTIRQPLRHSGSIAASTVLELLADPTMPARRVTLAVELIARDTA